MVYHAQTGHLGGAFLVAEILTYLYFHHLKIDPDCPDWPEPDRLLLSEGHACALLYTVIAYRGFFPVEELMTFRQLGSRLQGHPDRNNLKGIEICAGPLGHGIAMEVGMALAQRMGVAKQSAMSAPSARSSHGRDYIILGEARSMPGLSGKERWLRRNTILET